MMFRPRLDKSYRLEPEATFTDGQTLVWRWEQMEYDVIDGEDIVSTGKIVECEPGGIAHDDVPFTLEGDVTFNLAFPRLDD